MVSFTGSTRAGIEVAKNAAPTVKRVAQELGGKSANIVLDDADLDAVITRDMSLMCTNSGQSCNAPSRMLVPADLHGRGGDDRAPRPRRTSSSATPTPSRRGSARWCPTSSSAGSSSLIEKGIGRGRHARGRRTRRPEGLETGYYVQPTVFSHVTNDMTIAREEIFGPVMVMIGYEDDDDAVRIANDTAYGLSGYVSGSADRARAIARRIRSGNVHVNGAPNDLNAPFGGYKQSGNGREWGEHGIEEFLETKAILGYRA